MSSVASLLSGTPASVSREVGGLRIVAAGAFTTNGVVLAPGCLPTSLVLPMFLEGAPAAYGAVNVVAGAGSFLVTGTTPGAAAYNYVVLN